MNDIKVSRLFILLTMALWGILAVALSKFILRSPFLLTISFLMWFTLVVGLVFLPDKAPTKERPPDPQRKGLVGPISPKPGKINFRGKRK